MNDALPRLSTPVPEGAAFIARQLRRPSAAGLEGQRIVLLGSLPRRPASSVAPLPARAGWSELVHLGAGLLRCGGELVVLDCPRSRLLIETLLPLARDGQGRWQGSCRLEADLTAACRDAAALLLLPGWRPSGSLPWRTMAGRMRPDAQLFDFRPWDGLQAQEFTGLQVWRLGGSSLWT